MKLRFSSLLCGLALLLLMPAAAFAQEGTITGTVTDESDGSPLPGATVRVTTLDGVGTATDVDGNFTIEGVPAGEQALAVSFVGYITKEETVEVPDGGTVTINVELTFDTDELTEVVVTAQNIERQAKELGYSVTQLDGEGLAKGQETNFVNSLQGKVPGLQIQQQSGNVGASSRIVLRGIASLSGENQPLFVIDGTPIYNSNVSSGDRLTGYDTGNRAGDINAADIKSVTVLKGAAAAARYGQRAKNGAIIIRTKRGSDSPRPTVNVSSSVLGSRPLRLPDYQNEYSQGTLGKFDVDFLNGWGAPIQGQQIINFRDEPEALTSNPDNVSNFYNTGVILRNNISFSSSSETTDFRASVSQFNQDGTAPNSSLDRTNISFNAGTDLGNGVTARASVNYVKSNDQGRVLAGGNDPNVLVSTLVDIPRNISNAQLENYLTPDGQDQFALTANVNNPYWVANENVLEIGVERVFGSAQASYAPLNWLEFSGRIGTDFYTESRTRYVQQNTRGALLGSFFDDTIQQRQIDTDFIVSAEGDLSSDFNLKGLLGHNYNQRTFERLRNDAVQLNVRNVVSPGNARNNVPGKGFSERKLVGAYGEATLGFRDYAFLTLTGRNDWTSTLPPDNNAYFYPSINASLVLSEVLEQEFDITSSVLSYAKLRGNYAEVGSDTDPYGLNFLFIPDNDAFGQYGTALNFPFLGRTAYRASTQAPAGDDLVPQNQVSWEIGTELAFFNGRMNFDATYYSQSTEDQILSVPRPQSSGFNTELINAGEIQNTGVELVLNATVLSFEALDRDFLWRTNINFSRNVNEVVSLTEGTEEITLESGFNSFQIRAEPGKSLGIYGAVFARDSLTGLPLLNEAGLRQTGDDERVGGIFPDFLVGFGNTFTLGPVDVGVLIDWRRGGNIYSQTVQDVRGSGVAEETAANREGTFYDRGVFLLDDGTRCINDPNAQNPAGCELRPVPSMQQFWGAYTTGGIVEGGVFDASFVKLREVTVEYTLPPTLLNRTPLQAASLTLSGRNLLLLYSAIPHIDPETNQFGSGANVGQGYEFYTLPNSRTFGASLNLTF